MSVSDKNDWCKTCLQRLVEDAEWIDEFDLKVDRELHEGIIIEDRCVTYNPSDYVNITPRMRVENRTGGKK